VRPARGSGGVSRGIVGALMVVIWQHRHQGWSASHWQPGTCGAHDARRLDCAKSLLEVQRLLLAWEPLTADELLGSFARARVPDVPEIQALFRAAQPKVLTMAQRRGHTPAAS